MFFTCIRSEGAELQLIHLKNVKAKKGKEKGGIDNSFPFIPLQ